MMKEDLYTVYLCVIIDYMKVQANTCMDKGDIVGHRLHFALYESLTDTALECEEEHTGTYMCLFVWGIDTCRWEWAGVA